MHFTRSKIITFTNQFFLILTIFQLLVGIKDTNDCLVSVTLRTLADLVPILGASTVVGGKRAKLFNDYRPIQHLGRKSSRKPEVMQELVSTAVGSGLPERPRPDGEEVDTSTDEVEQSVDEDLDNWEDWDEETVHETVVSNESVSTNEDIELPTVEILLSNSNNRQTRLLPDITELDIKNQLNNSAENDEDIDFFQDMEPVIDTSNKFLVNVEDDGFLEKQVSSKLSLNINNDVHEDGWGEDDWD